MENKESVIADLAEASKELKEVKTGDVINREELQIAIDNAIQFLETK